MKIGVASEHHGFEFKDRILCQLRELKHVAFDYGPVSGEFCDYPDYAAKAARAVSSGDIDRAILIGGMGIGMCIVANKFAGVRAAVCQDDLSAQLSRRHFDANILCLAADILDDQLAMQMLEVWLTTPFEGQRHSRRIAKIAEWEQTIREE